MNRIFWAVPAVTVVLAAAALTYSQPANAQSKKKSKAVASAPVSATPKQENQFISVDEFVKGKRGAKTAVSVEGYAVLANRLADGGLHIIVVDSIDHVLSATDADNFGRGGAHGTIPASILAKHATWQWQPKGLQRFGMYTANGAGKAQKMLHDTVAKVRLTGFATGRAINPVTKVEYQDDSGEWKTL